MDFNSVANFFNNFHFLYLSQIKVSCVLVLIIVSENFQASKFVRFVFLWNAVKSRNPETINWSSTIVITSVIDCVTLLLFTTADPVYYNVALVHVSKHCQLIITVKQNGVVCVVYWIFLKGTLLLTVVVFLRCDLQLKADFICIFAIPFLQLNEECFIFRSTILDTLVCNACYFLN